MQTTMYKNLVKHTICGMVRDLLSSYFPSLLVSEILIHQLVEHDSNALTLLPLPHVPTCTIACIRP